MFDLNQYWNEFGGHNGNYFRRNILFQIGSDSYAKDVEKFRKDFFNTDIYQCIYAYENKDINNCKLYAPFYLDLDGDIKNEFDKLRIDVIKAINNLKSLLSLDFEDFEIYFSGAKGFHIIIRPDVLGITPSTNLNEVYKAWANHLYNTYKISSIDLSIYDRKRLFRIPGSINSKTGLHKFYVSYNYIRHCSAEELLKLASNPLVVLRRPKKRSLNRQAAIAFYTKSLNFYKKNKSSERKVVVVLPKEKKELLPCIKNLLETGIGEGSRNNMTAILSSAILQAGYSLNEALDIMNNWNANNEPPLTRKEIENTTRSAFSMLLDGRHYGCRAIQEYGYCLEKCKIKEGEKDGGVT